MKTWHVYRGKYGGIEVVKEGFNFWAFFFCGFWGFAKGLYGAGIFGIIGALALNRLPSEYDVLSIPLSIGLMILYGAKGNSWVTSSLNHDGYQFIAELSARNKKAAQIEAKKNYQKTPEPTHPN